MTSMNNIESKNIIKVDKNNVSIQVEKIKRFKDVKNVVCRLKLVPTSTNICYITANIESDFFNESYDVLYTATLYDLVVKQDSRHFFIENNDIFKEQMKKLKNDLLEETAVDILKDENKIDFFDDDDDLVEKDDDKICCVCYKDTTTVLDCCKKRVCKCCLHNISVNKKRKTLCPMCRGDHQQIEEDGFWKIENVEEEDEDEIE